MTLTAHYQEYGKNLPLECKVKVTHSVNILWKFKNQTLFENGRIKIELKNQSSKLIIRKANNKDTGFYQCIVK